jgi:hypothetical protein
VVRLAAGQVSVEGSVSPTAWVAARVATAAKSDVLATGMLGMLVATGLIGMEWERLAIAVVLFVVGTHVRIRAEERLLRGAFGVRFEEYARRVRALIPGIY